MPHPNEIELPHDLTAQPAAHEILRIWRTPESKLRIFIDHDLAPEPWGCAFAEMMKCIVAEVPENDRERVFRAIIEGYLEHVDAEFQEWRMQHAEEVKRRQLKRNH